MSANPTSGGSEFFRLTELAPAFEWQCDHCGRRNFVSAVRLEPEACRDLIEDDPELAGLDPEDLDGEFLQRPEVVVCPDCRTQYATFEEGDRPPEERVG